MTAGLFAPHRSDPGVVEELAGQLSRSGSQAATVAAFAGRYATTAATVDSVGLFDPIQSVLRPVTTAGDSLAAGRVGDLALRAWSHGVRAYNRTIDDLNAEWAQAKAAISVSVAWSWTWRR